MIRTGDRTWAHSAGTGWLAHDQRGLTPVLGSRFGEVARVYYACDVGSFQNHPFNMGNPQKHGLEKNRGRELRKTEPDCKKPRKIGRSCMLRGLVLQNSPGLSVKPTRISSEGSRMVCGSCRACRCQPRGSVQAPLVLDRHAGLRPASGPLSRGRGQHPAPDDARLGAAHRGGSVAPLWPPPCSRMWMTHASTMAAADRT